MQTWKCWSGIALRAAQAALDGDDNYGRTPPHSFMPYSELKTRPFNATKANVNIFPGVWRVNSNSSTPYMMMMHGGNKRRRRLRQRENSYNTSYTNVFYSVNTRDENIRKEIVDTMDNSHPILQSACWYLDFNWDIDKYLNSDMLKGTICS